jgi:ADP-ribose pyrophosphatase YjhB (NUDIX family)
MTKLVADVALIRDDRILLVKYEDVRRNDGQTGWFLPDDYIQRLEHPMDSGSRILREQVGLGYSEFDLGFIESFESEGDWHLVFHLVGRLDHDVDVAATGNTAEAAWFQQSSLPPRAEMAH